MKKLIVLHFVKKNLKISFQNGPENETTSLIAITCPGKSFGLKFIPNQ